MEKNQSTVDTSSERNYIAFISYRHKPLDKSVAQKLHRRIERYVIPKELRGEDGGSKLGLVFRDQDELPISSNLTDNIYYALDHSEYLIVVCSPDTPHSLWVQREITYFLEHHDRDHLLAILVDGEPEQSFPPQLTEVRDSEGELIEEIEPLAANIVAESDRDRNKLFNTESLRILAALIGCPFDALYHREQRYRLHRLMITALIAAVIAAGFIGLLINRNLRIQERLYQSMINESQALSALSESAFRDGDYRGALNYALDALPGRNPERPYYADAEYALSSALYLYRGDYTMRYIQSFEQNTEIVSVVMSQDGSRIATGDRLGNIHVSDMKSGQLLWTAATDDVWDLYFIGDYLFVRGLNKLVYSAEGEVVYQSDQGVVLDVWEEKESYMCSYDDDEGYFARIIDIKNGDVLHDLKISDGKYVSVDWGAVSPDGRYAAVMATNPDKNDNYDLFLFELESGKRKTIYKNLLRDSIMTSYTLDFDEKDNLVLTCSGREDFLADNKEWKGHFVMLFDSSADWSARFTKYLDFGSSSRLSAQETEYMDYIDCAGNSILMAARNRLISVDNQTGKIQFQIDLPDRVKDARVLGEVMFMILGNGMITTCNVTSGYLSSDLGMLSFDCQNDLYTGAIIGDNLEGLRFALVPSDYRSRTSIVAFCQSTETERPAWMEPLDGFIYFFMSPSRTKLAAVYRERSSYDSTLYYKDLSDDQDAVVLSIPEMNPYSILMYNQSRTVLTDNGKLILGDRYVDFESGEVHGLTGNGDYSEYSSRQHLNASCTDRESGKVITASVEEKADTGSYQLLLWEDAKLTGQTSIVPVEQSESDSPYSFNSGECFCRGISADGFVAVCSTGFTDTKEAQYVLYDINNDTWTKMEYMSSNKKQLLEMAESHPWIAIQKEDGNLAIVELTSGKELWTLENTLPTDKINRLLFTRDDTLLIAFSGSGALTVYDTADGKELHRSYYNGSGLRFSDEGRYEAYYIPESNRILIIYDNVDNSVPVAITLDAGSLKKTGFYPGISCYFPEDNTVLFKPVYVAPAFSKLYSLEEMNKMAEDLLNGSEAANG